MGYRIVTDSSCNLPESMIDAFDLHIFPLTFMVDEVQYQSYLKGQVTDLSQFYTMMREGKVITRKQTRRCGRSWMQGMTSSTSASPAGFLAPTRPSRS